VHLTDLRTVAGLFATGVTVVSAPEEGTDVPHGMTANGFMSVSLDPALVCVSVSVRARLHEVLSAAPRYGVTLLGADLEPEARRFAGQIVTSSPAHFDYHGGVPVLAGGLAWLTCRTLDRHRAGDHTLFIAEVVEMMVERPDAPPLAFYRSRFSAVNPVISTVPVSLDPWSGVGDLWG
jgi:flavin reductase (DIM6/NTAB) family NADH-FMN oxidoreductase RutF